MKIAILPARGGSKRVPRKNIKPFCGRPMIEWPLTVLRNSGIFDKILVSTDDDEVKSVALRAGADVPFRRPEYLSDDYTGTREVIEHAIGPDGVDADASDLIMCVYPTAPFVVEEDIRTAVRLFMDKGGSGYVFAATEYRFPVQRALRIDEMGRSRLIDSEMFAVRSQDLEKRFHDAGQFYLATASTWRSERNFFDNSLPIVLPSWRVQDIDTLDDWERAEIMMKVINQTA